MCKRTHLFLRTLAAVVVSALASRSLFSAEPAQFPITARGALGDGTTVNTKTIQTTIDQCAAAGGGTVVIPEGNFLTGALFLKPNVNLQFSQGAVLLGSKNIDDFPVRKNQRFEGHFRDLVAALLNVEKCDHFRLTGPGTIDGNGAAYWSKPSPNGLPRLCVVRDSNDVAISGVHFLNSPIWNLHLYNCKNSLVENCRFEIPENTKGPSTDGTDIDSSQDITVKGCYYSVDDDCICLKGNRYDGLNQEPPSLPVQNIHISDSTFVRGMGALTLGTEATIIRDVEMDHCLVRGKMPILRIKLRPDTAGQDYANVHVHDITADGRGPILSLEPSHGTKVSQSALRKITHVVVENITGSVGSFGKFAGGPTVIVSDIALSHINVKAASPAPLNADQVTDLKLDNVVVNDEPVSATQPTTRP